MLSTSASLRRCVHPSTPDHPSFAKLKLHAAPLPVYGHSEECVYSFPSTLRVVGRSSAFLRTLPSRCSSPANSRRTRLRPCALKTATHPSPRLPTLPAFKAVGRDQSCSRSRSMLLCSVIPSTIRNCSLADVTYRVHRRPSLRTHTRARPVQSPPPRLQSGIIASSPSRAKIQCASSAICSQCTW
jgi:hypothetical protein